MMMIGDPVVRYVGIAFVIYGMIAIVFVGKMRFDRTNEYGVELYSNYFKMLVMALFQFFVLLTGWPALMFGLFLWVVNRS